MGRGREAVRGLLTLLIAGCATEVPEPDDTGWEMPASCEPRWVEEMDEGTPTVPCGFGTYTAYPDGWACWWWWCVPPECRGPTICL